MNSLVFLRFSRSSLNKQLCSSQKIGLNSKRWRSTVKSQLIEIIGIREILLLFHYRKSWRKVGRISICACLVVNLIRLIMISILSYFKILFFHYGSFWDCLRSGLNLAYLLRVKLLRKVSLAYWRQKRVLVLAMLSFMLAFLISLFVRDEFACAKRLRSLLLWRSIL